MDPETATVPQEWNNKKIVVLVSVLVLVLLGILAYILTMNGTPTQTPEAEVSTTQDIRKPASQEEKQRILENLARASSGATVSQAEKQRILSNLAKKSPATSISQEEKQRILAELSATAGQ